MNTNILNKYFTNEKKIKKKPVGGVFSSEDWSQKKLWPK